MTAPAFRRVEHHMSTAVSLGGTGIDDATADRFFARIAELEGLLSRFRLDSEISRLADGRIAIDDVHPEVREVLDRCADLRARTLGDFEHEPRARTGRAGDPVLDVNALAKGWIIEEAATILRLASDDFFVNAGGDVLARGGDRREPWRIGVQHPNDATAVLGVFELSSGAVATSGTYERGDHIRAAGPPGDDHPVSVSVVGPDLGEADALSTAAFAAGVLLPAWWADVEPSYGLLVMTGAGRLRWCPPAAGSDVRWHFPA